LWYNIGEVIIMMSANVNYTVNGDIVTVNIPVEFFPSHKDSVSLDVECILEDNGDIRIIAGNDVVFIRPIENSEGLSLIAECISS
jgi:hypothetical protein